MNGTFVHPSDTSVQAFFDWTEGQGVLNHEIVAKRIFPVMIQYWHGMHLTFTVLHDDVLDDLENAVNVLPLERLAFLRSVVTIGIVLTVWVTFIKTF